MGVVFDSLIAPHTHPATGGVGVAFTDRFDGFSASDIGPLNLGRADVDDPALVGAGFEAVRAALGVRAIIATHQVHGADVLVVDDALLADWTPRSPLGTDGGARPLPVADAMVTALPDVALAIRIADCMPVLFADGDHGIIGAAHAGRVGLLGGVLPATVQRMRDLGATGIRAWLGPHICGSCYEVPADMLEDAAATLPAVRATTSWGTPAIDLALGAAAQLEALGVPLERRDPCTLENEHLHSHRRTGPRSGRLAGLVWRVSNAG